MRKNKWIWLQNLYYWDSISSNWTSRERSAPRLIPIWKYLPKTWCIFNVLEVLIFSKLECTFWVYNDFLNICDKIWMTILILKLSQIIIFVSSENFFHQVSVLLSSYVLLNGNTNTSCKLLHLLNLNYELNKNTKWILRTWVKTLIAVLFCCLTHVLSLTTSHINK